MHSLAKKFMMARKLNFGEKGRAELLDEPVFLMDGKMLSEITNRSGPESSYEIGKVTGRTLAEKVSRTGASGTKMDEFMMDLLTMMGLGQFDIHEFDVKGKEGEVRVSNCLVSREEEKDGGCDIVAGIIAGVFSANYERDFDVKEVGCVIKGDSICRFEIEPL